MTQQNVFLINIYNFIKREIFSIMNKNNSLHETSQSGTADRAIANVEQ